MNYNGSEYFYTLNIHGDVIELVDINGTAVVKYKYDYWGNIIYQTPNQAIGDINPLDIVVTTMMKNLDYTICSQDIMILKLVDSSVLMDLLVLLAISAVITCMHIVQTLQ